jgi:hypothetical protein
MLPVGAYLQAKVQSKIGITSTVVVATSLAVVSGIVMLIFALVTLFEFLSEHYGPVIGGLIVTLVFLVLSLAFAVVAVVSHRNAIKAAKRQLLKTPLNVLLKTQYRRPLFLLMNQMGARKFIPVAGLGLLLGGFFQELKDRGKRK